jgi:His-Xaa-Ser system radical SAM maturase HxsB
MAKFRPREAFGLEPDEKLRLLPIRFERGEGDAFIVANMVGEMATMSGSDLNRLTSLQIAPGDGLYETAMEKLFIAREDQKAPLQLLALRLRSRMAYLQEPSALQIFVVTLRCEHSCPYCQVSRRSVDRGLYDMSQETASRALDIALSSPSRKIKLEFQGGEPLLNFELIQYLVIEAEVRAPSAGKQLEFVITTNLALLTDEVLEFCKLHGILISTSLDGPADLHNRNRPRPGGNSHKLTISGIRRAKLALGEDAVGALMTTSEASLGRVEEIVDEYLAMGLDGIFLRPISPYGFAIKTKQFKRYGVDEWLEFYERGLRYVLSINRGGTRFPELYAALLISRMMTDRPSGYVDLRSPAGIGLGALVYNYDGKVFASDEGRMLAEMGDRTFELGDVQNATYESLVLSDKLVELVSSSLTQCAPMCSTCAFEPNCGADPAYHVATQGEPQGMKPFSEFCARQKGLFRLLMRIMAESKEDEAILRSWVFA